MASMNTNTFLFIEALRDFQNLLEMIWSVDIPRFDENTDESDFFKDKTYKDAYEIIQKLKTESLKKGKKWSRVLEYMIKEKENESARDL